MAATLPPLLHSGKVRDTYPHGSNHLVVVASNRISTFDVVHPTPIPDKGGVLTAMTQFWLEVSGISVGVPHHLISTHREDLPDWAKQFAGRAMLVKRLDMLPIEAIVRGYITGSAWKQYKLDGTMNGVVMPEGMLEAQRLDEFTFTPSTKAVEGHDENISIDEAVRIIGAENALRIEEASLELYTRAHHLALKVGIIIADTKLEFGIDPETGELVLGDEVLTPDSSRFWPADQWQPGSTPPAMDKQYVRDWAESTGWNKRPPAPPIPTGVVAETHRRYIDIAERLTARNPLA